MKKLIMFLFAVISVYSAKAQYGQRIYYLDSLSNESWVKGFVSKNLSGGLPTYAVTGTIDPFQAPVPHRMRFARIGQTGTLFSNRMYKLTKSGFELPATSNGIAENLGKYVMAGSIQAHPAVTIIGGSDVVILKTTTGGVPANPVRFVDLGGGYDEALCIKNSRKDNSKFFTCGYSTINGSSRAFLMKHDATALNVYWAKYFNLPCPVGAIGDARATYLIDDSASGKVIVIGTIQTSQGCRNSFLARFTSGGVLDWCYIYSAVGGIDFNSIKATEVPNEYIIAGTVNLPAPTNDRVLLFRVKTTGASPVTIFSNVLFSNGPSSNFPIDNQYGYDVCERILPGKKEYYVTGMTSYNFGSTDGHVFKCDSLGNPINPNGVMLYGGPNADRLNAIDWINSLGTPGDGLATFGKYSQPGGIPGFFPADKSWYIKSYFNLISGCNEIADSALVAPVSLSKFLFNPTVFTVFTKDTATAPYVNCTKKTLCWAINLVGGSNLKVPQNDFVNNGSIINVYPNPLATGELTISFNSGINEKISIEVMDMTGKLIRVTTAMAYEGANEFKVDLSEVYQGCYIVRVTTSSGVSQKKILKE